MYKIWGQRAFNSFDFKLKILYNFQLLSYSIKLYVLYDPVTIHLKVNLKLFTAIYLLIYTFNSKICRNNANKNKKLHTYWYNQCVIKKLVKLQWKKYIERSSHLNEGAMLHYRKIRINLNCIFYEEEILSVLKFLTWDLGD